VDSGDLGGASCACAPAHAPISTTTTISDPNAKVGYFQSMTCCFPTRAYAFRFEPVARKSGIASRKTTSWLGNLVARAKPSSIS